MVTVLFVAAENVLTQEHTIDGRVVDVKAAVGRDQAPAPTRYSSIYYDPTKILKKKCRDSAEISRLNVINVCYLTWKHPKSFKSKIFF